MKLPALLTLLPLILQATAAPAPPLSGPHVLPINDNQVRVLRRKPPSTCNPTPEVNATSPDLDDPSKEHSANSTNSFGDEHWGKNDTIGNVTKCSKKKKYDQYGSWLDDDEECEDEEESEDKDEDEEEEEDWEDNNGGTHNNGNTTDVGNNAGNSTQGSNGTDTGVGHGNSTGGGNSTDSGIGHWNGTDAGNPGLNETHTGNGTDAGGGHWNGTDTGEPGWNQTQNGNGTDSGNGHWNGTSPGNQTDTGNVNGNSTETGGSQHNSTDTGAEHVNSTDSGTGNGNSTDAGSSTDTGASNSTDNGGWAGGDLNNSTDTWAWVDPFSPSDWVPDSVRHINDEIPSYFNQALRYVPRRVDYSSDGPSWLRLARPNALGTYASLNVRRGAQATFYSLQNPSENHGYDKTACGVDNPPDTYPLVAIPMVNWNELWGGDSWSAPFCGHLVRVRYGNRSATAQVLDGCATCGYNSLDLSPALFYYLTGSKEAGDKLGIMRQEQGFSWEWLDDPAKEMQELPADGFHWDGKDPVGSNSGYFDANGNPLHIDDVW